MLEQFLVSNGPSGMCSSFNTNLESQNGKSKTSSIPHDVFYAHLDNALIIRCDHTTTNAGGDTGVQEELPAAVVATLRSANPRV